MLAQRQAVVGARKPAGDFVAVAAPPGALAFPDTHRLFGFGFVAAAALYQVGCGDQLAASRLQRLALLPNFRFRHGRCHGLGWHSFRGVERCGCRQHRLGRGSVVRAGSAHGSGSRRSCGSRAAGPQLTRLRLLVCFFGFTTHAPRGNKEMSVILGPRIWAYLRVSGHQNGPDTGHFGRI